MVIVCRKLDKTVSCGLFPVFQWTLLTLQLPWTKFSYQLKTELFPTQLKPAFSTFILPWRIWLLLTTRKGVSSLRTLFALSALLSWNDMIYLSRTMEIVLCKNGSLNIGMMSKDASYVYTFPYNYSDGYRHFFQSKFRGRKPLKITVSYFNF